VWKHTLAAISPTFHKTSVQNQKLKPAEESFPFSAAAVSPSQAIIDQHPFVLYGLSGYSDACNLTPPLQKRLITLPCSVSSKGDLPPHAFH
jgi:hypothetical protein